MQHARCNTQCNTQDAAPKHATCRFRRGFDSSWPCTTQTIRSAGLPPLAEAHDGTRTPWPLEPMAYSEYPFSISTPCAARAATSARAIGRLAFRMDALHERCTARPGADAMPWCIASASRHTSCCSGDADGALLQRHLHSEGNPTGQAHPPTASKQTSGRAAMHEQANNPSGKPGRDGTGQRSAAQRSAAQPGNCRWNAARPGRKAANGPLPLAPARSRSLQRARATAIGRRSRPSADGRAGGRT